MASLRDHDDGYQHAPTSPDQQVVPGRSTWGPLAPSGWARSWLDVSPQETLGTCPHIPRPASQAKPVHSGSYEGYSHAATAAVYGEGTVSWSFEIPCMLPHLVSLAMKPPLYGKPFCSHHPFTCHEESIS